MNSRPILVAGTHSGVGKTTIALGLIAALKQRGLQVQPFKAGPDYIDPTYHALAADRPCRNLDTWMVPPERVSHIFQKAVQDVDIAVIEGVMGVFDGFSYEDEVGSTAEISKLLDAAVLLVLDVGKMARSAGALALGYTRFDPALNFAGFILNRCGSESHYQGVKQAVERATGLSVWGWLPKAANLHIPERHLGLIPTDERGQLTDFINHAANIITEYFDLDRIIEFAQGNERTQLPLESFPSKIVNHQSKIKIAVARDPAFSFYYEDNLDLLREAGAEIAFFSPLVDTDLPSGTSGLYLGGGFPEIYAKQLAANKLLHKNLQTAHQNQMPIYAECGGFMYLTQSITDLQNQTHPMVGLVPGTVQMEQRLARMGYRLVETPTGNFLLPPGITTRGHEFHWSSWSVDNHQRNVPPAWQIRPRQEGLETRPDGYADGNLIASYVHLHFAHKPILAENFVKACAKWAKQL